MMATLLFACAGFQQQTGDGGSGTGWVDDYEWTDLELEIHDLINGWRDDVGLSLLDLHGAIGGPTRQHSEDMLAGDVAFSHDGFEERVDVIMETLGLLTAGENVAATQGYEDPAGAIVLGWLESPGHLENIEGDWDLTGIGAAEGPGDTVYITQIFVLSD